MRRNAVCTFLLASFLFAAPLSMAATRHESSCVQQCAAQWAQDKRACQAALELALEQIDATLATCLSQAHGGQAVARCQRAANTSRHLAQNSYRRCVSQANTTAWNCTRACAQSHSAP
jgi:hypothetical protein